MRPAWSRIFATVRSFATTTAAHERTVAHRAP
jgi:hypothetical protein